MSKSDSAVTILNSSVDEHETSSTCPELISAVSISFIQGIIEIQISNCEKNCIADELIQNILVAVQNFDLNGVDVETIGNSFFKNESVNRNKVTDGIVETPNYIARFIISNAYRRWRTLQLNNGQHQDAPHWLDPCSGAGVFPREVISFYWDELGARQISEFPYITFAELSPIGLTLTLCNIKLELQLRGLSFTEYLASGRLNFYCGDSLQLFPEESSLFHKEPAFDIVVGNPPYVRATRLTTQYKQLLRQYAPNVYSGGADLYTYFIASAIANLRPNGVLGFISPAAYTRAKSGEILRKWLQRKACLVTYLDLDETKVFPDAQLHSAIYILIKQLNQNSIIQYQTLSKEAELSKLRNGTLAFTEAIFECGTGAWSFHSSDKEYKDYETTFRGTKPLHQLGIKVYSGVRTGYSEAFIMDENKYQTFTEIIRKKWFKPTILPANIKRWHGAKQQHFMLVIPSGTKIIDQELLEYLLQFKERLSRRVEANKSNDWFTLRPCSYYSEMSARKIAFPDLSAKQRFSLVDSGIFIPDGAYFIDSDDPILLGILNSSIAKMYFTNTCSSVGNLSTKGRFRFKKNYVQNYPVPANFQQDGPIQSEIRLLVEGMIENGESNELMEKLDQLVIKLYDAAK